MLQGCTHGALGVSHAGTAASRSLYCTKISAHVSNHNNKTPVVSLYIDGDTPCQQSIGAGQYDLAYPPWPIGSPSTLLLSSNPMAAMEVSLECPIDEALFGHATAHPVWLT